MKKRFYKLDEPRMFADVTDGTAIIIDSTTGVYYGMNGFGTSVFENLRAGASSVDVLEAAKALAGAPDDVETAIDNFLASLVDAGIVTASEEGVSMHAELDQNAAAADAFIPTCTTYKDVQELLFADPIHEVDVDEGWRPE